MIWSLLKVIDGSLFYPVKSDPAATFPIYLFCPFVIQKVDGALSVSSLLILTFTDFEHFHHHVNSLDYLCKKKVNVLTIPALVEAPMLLMNVLLYSPASSTMKQWPEVLKATLLSMVKL